MSTTPKPEVTFCPMFSEEDPDRLLLLKFVTWPDDELVYCYRLNWLGTWIEFDPEDPNDFDVRDLPQLVEVDVEVAE